MKLQHFPIFQAFVTALALIGPVHTASIANPESAKSLISSTDFGRNCSWFGAGPNCTATFSSNCPGGWTSTLQSASSGEGIDCVEGHKDYCCVDDVEPEREPGFRDTYEGDEDGNVIESNENEVGNNNMERNLGGFNLVRKKQYELVQFLSSQNNPGGIVLEARLICPTETNDGGPLLTVRDELEKRIIKEFGGFSRFDGDGGWMDDGILYDEKNWIYDIAVANTEENRRKLKKLANWLKKAAEQLAIYLRMPGGQVTFV